MPNQCLLIVLLSAVFLLNSTMGCFLNSCPYRRYGRSPTCGQCGVNNDGLCVSSGVCCMDKICVDTEECQKEDEGCQIPQCMLGGLNGVCVSEKVCCIGRICSENLQCMTGKDRKRTR